MFVLIDRGEPLMVSSSVMMLIENLQTENGRDNVFYETQWRKDRNYLTLNVNGQEMYIFQVPQV